MNSPRAQQILQALARMLETSANGKITTAALAAEVGVSEAALYRHFPSKTKMYEGLIDFIEETVFSRVNAIVNEESDVKTRLYRVLSLLLTFTERNPGITRLLTGDALTGETSRLHTRIQQLFDRLETQLKQVLREAEIQEGARTTLVVSAAANLLLSAAEGRISQYVRSGFSRRPTENWQDQWQVLMDGFFHPEHHAVSL
ncbi:MAG: nucleoid occlusion factor SlmA [Porticoccaceae bacterium]|nr:nucleoid occlusion factor SlmA [Pseudomonadales bacterium]MCP5172864.1 nucleoid occlusion factor SlmA [Pseudomonadales bacterium]MCP5302338.1 nucleoid occlusion factor SlmA [Pseudomonadales bacterium]